MKRSSHRSREKYIFELNYMDNIKGDDKFLEKIIKEADRQFKLRMEKHSLVLEATVCGGITLLSMLLEWSKSKEYGYDKLSLISSNMNVAWQRRNIDKIKLWEIKG